MKYRITIGDWSGDGHDKSEDVILSSPAAIDIRDVEKALNKAIKIVPRDLSPYSICTEYEECTVSTTIAAEIDSYYGTEWSGEDPADSGVYVTVEMMGDLLAKFITKGGLKTTLVDDDIPKLYTDASIGYGLFT